MKIQHAAIRFLGRFAAALDAATSEITAEAEKVISDEMERQVRAHANEVKRTIREAVESPKPPTDQEQ